MSLAAGTKLGPYEITGAIGAGGMGEVYRAKDTKLGRDVAVKVLPETFAADPERMARFEREAKVLASLNHPNIAHIYGLEDSGAIRALIMELVEGPTLAARIAQGPIPLEDALSMAKQVAVALEYAHEHSIVHRDLKPANVKVTNDGAVKVLDFGLAKAIDDTPAVEEITNSPTLSMGATRAGVILGTAAYMSPEQAKGKSADRRADIWSFGVLLYEMISGKQLYSGETAPETLAHVITKEPTWEDLPASTPTPIRHLLERCLTKDPKARLQAIGEARIIIERYLANPSASTSSIERMPSQEPASRRFVPWAIAALAIVAALLVLWAPWRKPPEAPAAVHFKIPAPAEETFQMNGGGLAISPDGAYVVFSSSSSKAPPRRQLYLRTLSKDESFPIRGSEDASNPFFSPDGQWIGFIANGKVEKISLSGGTPIALCDKCVTTGATWGPDDRIYLTDRITKILSIPAAGGTPQEVATIPVKMGAQGVRWPRSLPGGEALLYVVSGSGALGSDDAQICVVKLKTGQHKTLIQGGTFPRYISSGHLVYAQGGRLLAVPFDLQKLEVTGIAVPVYEDVWQGTGGYSAFDVSENGTLVSVTGGEHFTQAPAELDWVDRKGEAKRIEVQNHPYLDPKISPDGKLVALTVRGGYPESEINVLDLARNTLTRVTFTKTGDWADHPIWTPDGKRLIYATGEGFKLAWKPADGTGAEEVLYSSDVAVQPAAVLSDGRLLFERGDARAASDLWMLDLKGDHNASPFIEDKFRRLGAQISPDGRWLAYTQRAETSSSDQVYVQPLPGLEGKWQVSTEEGSTSPVWSRDGKQLFYRQASGKLMAVDVDTKTRFTPGVPRLLFVGPFRFSRNATDYDIAPDGQHFLMTKVEDVQNTSPFELRVVLNWTEEMKGRTGTAKK